MLQWKLWWPQLVYNWYIEITIKIKYLFRDKDNMNIWYYSGANWKFRDRRIIWRACTRVHRELVSVVIENDSVAFAWLTTCKVITSHIQSILSRTETDLWRHRTVDLSAVIHIRGQWPAQEKRNKIKGDMMNNCCLRVMTEKQSVSSVSQVSLWGSMWKRSQCFSDLEEALSVFVILSAHFVLAQ